MAQKLTLGKRLLKLYTVPETTFLRFMDGDEELAVEFKLPVDYISQRNLYTDAMKAAESYADDERELMSYVYLMSFVVKNVEFGELEELARHAPTVFDLFVNHYNDVYNNPSRYCTKEAMDAAEKKSEMTPTTE